MTRSIVVVHGVGSPEFGSEIKKIADAVAEDNSTMKISCVRSHNTDVAVGELKHEGETLRLYELNWSDVVGPVTGAWQTLRQLFYLIFAAAQIAQAGWDGGNSDDRKSVYAPSQIGTLYRLVLVTVTLWAPILSATVIIAEILNETNKTAAFSIVLCIGFAVFLGAQMLGNIEPLAKKAGQFWACAIILLGSAVATGLIERDNIRYIPTGAVLVGIYGSGLLLLAGILQSFMRGNFSRQSMRASSFRAAMFVIPFMVLAAAWGPIVFTAQFMIVDRFVGVGELTWVHANDVYQSVAKNIPYPIVSLEIVNFLAFVLSVVVLVLFMFVWGACLGLNSVRAQNWGGKFRSLVAVWLLLLLFAGMASFVPVFFETLGHYLGFDSDNNTKLPDSSLVNQLVSIFSPAGEADNRTALEFYRVSMWRVSAVLLLLMPMVAQTLVIFSQIIFYICPNWSPLSTRNELIEQFENVAGLAFQQCGEAPIVLAYSQGSKIAADALTSCRTPLRSLVTIGSPVDAIHGSFLMMPVPQHEVTWKNFYRSSDFIGGAIGSANVQNQQIEKNFTSTHFNYYREQRVLAAIGLA